MQEGIRALSGKPFAPNSGFQLSTAQHKQLVEALWTAARKSFPLIVLTGPEGAGKSLLVRHLQVATPPDVSVLDISTGCVARNGSTAVAGAAEHLTAALTRTVTPSNFKDLMDDVQRSGRHLLLIVDNAEEVLDSRPDVLTGLLERASKSASAPTLLLVGTPKLEALLGGSRFSALTRRRGVIFRFHPMTAEETAAYIRRRLQLAGVDPETFDETAVATVHRAASGLPKQVDVLCSGALAAMCKDGRHTVDSAQLDAVVARVHGRNPFGKFTELRNLRREFDVGDLETEDFVVEDPSKEHAEFLPVVEPSEFIFLSRDRPEAVESKFRSESGAIAAEREQRKHVPILQPADSQLPGQKDTHQIGGEVPDLVAATAATVEGRIARAEISVPGPRHRAVFASSVRPVSAILGGVTAVALCSMAIVAILGGGRGDDPARVVIGVPSQSGEATTSRLGIGSAVDMSPSGDAIRRGSGYQESVVGDAAPPQIGVSAGDAVASKTWQDAGGSIDTADLQIGELETVPPDQAGADRFFREALELASQNRRAAVLAFSRAAIRGHTRSAYYLGQIYETGDGVPADTALARAWYGLAGSHVRARQRLAELTERSASPDQNGGTQASAPPELALADRSSAGILDLVWIGARGADSSSGYIVELAENPDGPPVLRAFSGVSALRLPYHDADELWWRVLSMNSAEASTWQRVPFSD